VSSAARPSSGASSSGRTAGGRGGGSRRQGQPQEGGESSAGGVSRAGPPEDPLDAARQICLSQLEFAPRTRAELAATLRKKRVEDAVADEVLGRFAEVGMIDDALFAQMWVTSRHRGRGLAGRALRQELRRKGVDDGDIAAAVATLDPEQEAATARALVDRKLRATRGLTTDARVRRLAGMLARKGCPAGLAFRVVRDALAEEGEEAELAFDQLQTLDDEP
jgi:regulatory protein